MEDTFVYFDLDRTLIDHDRAERAAVRQFHDRHSDRLSASFESFLARWREVAEHHWKRYENGELSYHEQKRERIRVLLDGASTALSDEAVDRYLSRYLDMYASHCRLFPDVRNVLDRLQEDVEMGILTNGGGQLQRRKLKGANVSGYFGPVICSNEVGRPKPNPTIFRHACEQAERDPEQIVYVGDRPDLDVKPARSLGMTGVWLDRPDARSAGAAPEESVPVVRDLEEFADLLQSESGQGND